MNPTYTIAMLDVFFSRIEGFLVSLVFFSDPAVTSMIVEGYRNFYQKYVVEYTTVTKEEMGNIMKECKHLQTKPNFFSSPTARHPEMLDTQANYKLTKTSSPGVDMGEGNQSVILQDRTQQTTEEMPKVIPVRKIVLCVPEKRRTANYKHASLYLTSSQSSNGENGNREGEKNATKSKELFVPYRYPNIAKIIHRLMCISKSKNHGSVSGKEEQSAELARVESAPFEEASSLEENSRRESSLCQSKSSLLISKY